MYIYIYILLWDKTLSCRRKPLRRAGAPAHAAQHDGAARHTDGGLSDGGRFGTPEMDG